VTVRHFLIFQNQCPAKQREEKKKMRVGATGKDILKVSKKKGKKKLQYTRGGSNFHQGKKNEVGKKKKRKGTLEGEVGSFGGSKKEGGTGKSTDEIEEGKGKKEKKAKQQKC